MKQIFKQKIYKTRNYGNILTCLLIFYKNKPKYGLKSNLYFKNLQF